MCKCRVAHELQTLPASGCRDSEVPYSIAGVAGYDIDAVSNNVVLFHRTQTRRCGCTGSLLSGRLLYPSVEHPVLKTW